MSSFSSAEGAGGAAGAAAASSSFLRVRLPMMRITTKIENAMMRKSNVCCKKLP